MHTPKYNINLNRHTTHATSPSPLRSAPKPSRYFSNEEVHKLIKANFEPKIQYLMQELEDRQQIIAKLNNKLNENDEKLMQQSSLIDNLLRKNKETTNWQSYVVATVNQLINDKSKQYWDTIGQQLKNITLKVQHDLDSKKIESTVQI
jgi:predicted phage tail protein